MADRPRQRALPVDRMAVVRTVAPTPVEIAPAAIADRRQLRAPLALMAAVRMAVVITPVGPAVEAPAERTAAVMAAPRARRVLVTAAQTAVARMLVVQTAAAMAQVVRRAVEALAARTAVAIARPVLTEAMADRRRLRAPAAVPMAAVRIAAAMAPVARTVEVLAA